MHIIRCVLCVVIFIIVLFLFNSTFNADTTHSAHSTADVDKYILLTVDTKTHQPTHIVLFHKNQHALCKDMTRPNRNWKLCSYTWNAPTRHLRYHYSNHHRYHSTELPPKKNKQEHQQKHQQEHQQKHQPNTPTHTSIRFQPLQQKHSASPPAYIAYQPKHTSYLWKPTPNAFRCSALVGQTLSIQPNNPNAPNNKASITFPFDAVQIQNRKQARVRLPTNQRWVDCRFTCRKMSGGAARRFDAVLYIKPAQQNHNRDHNHKHNHKHHNNVPFQTAVLRWRGGRVARVEWLDGRGVRWVEACGGK